MKGKWIWLNNKNTPDSYVDFVDDFQKPKGKCFIRISCDSNYALWINDTLAGFSQYSDYPWHKFYNEHDLTDFLRNGKNSIKITVWYYGQANFSYYVGKPCLYYEVYNEDVVLAYSSTKTKARKAQGYVEGLNKKITDQLGLSFKYDCNAEGEEFVDATEIDLHLETFVKRPIKNLSCKEFAEGILVSREKCVYDLGQETVGLLKIDFIASKGFTVNIAYGEHLENGNVKRKIHNRDFSVEVVGNGKRTVYLNPFRRMGGRYLQITSDGDFEIYHIGLMKTDYPFEEKYIRLGVLIREQIYKISVQTLKLCYHEHYEDCPWREQGLYGLDARLQMLFGYFAFSGTECQRASLELFCLNVNEDGLLPICSPTSHEQPPIPSFSLFFIVAMQEYIQYSGDITLAEKYLGVLKKMMDFFIQRMQNGLVQVDVTGKYWNFYEWSDNMWGDPKNQKHESTDCMINCITSMALDSFAKIHESLGFKTEADKYKILKREINQSIFETFYIPEKGVFKMFIHGYETECVNTCAILCGAIEGEQAQRLADILVQGNSLSKCTLSMKTFKYDALIKTDKEKYRQYILDEIEVIYAKMLESGATSFWETELGREDFDGAGSLCHGWSALPVYFYNILNG